MIARKHIEEIKELGQFLPVIGILGPRQVGKTTLVKEFSKTIDKTCVYLDLEKPSDFKKLEEAELYFSANPDKCIIIDEIQIKPGLFPIIRAMVDENRIPLRFIILGSASPDIIRDSSESLAGRIGYIALGPFSLSELKDVALEKHHFLGGFPGSILANSDKQSLKWLDNFIKTYIERDLPMLGFSASPLDIRRLWEMLSWQSGNLLNASAIGNSLGFTNHTINKYIDFLEGTFMVNRLPPFFVNAKKRIVKSPKIYISDTGVLHRLMRVNSFDELSGMPVLGASFETYVLQQIMTEKPADIDLYFYRTHAGTEIDIVLTKALKPVTSLEVKYTSTPKVTKGLLNGIEDLGTTNNYIIVPRSEPYPIRDHIQVCGIRQFLENNLHDM